MWVALNKKNIIMAVSEQPFNITGYVVKEVENSERANWSSLIGKKLNSEEKKEPKDLKVVFICNWNENCGISTYSRYLVEALMPKLKSLTVLSEIAKEPKVNDPPFVVRCWERGTSLKLLIDKILDIEPDFVIIQHEFGIFPKATYFLQLLQGLNDIPYVVTMHSVYEHLDKSVCTSAVKNIVVHSQEGKEILRKLGNTNEIVVIPHGCVEFQDADKSELWNIFQTPYAIVQFGFGFFYKGVDKILDAIHYLKNSDRKFHNIFYCYLCSENFHTNVVHAQYYEFLLNKIEELNLHDNAVIIKKFQTEKIIKNYLRTAKLSVFPYVSDPKNTVYGASGAIRIAMACRTSVIGSDCHQFDDLDGVIPRPHTYLDLAKEIDKIFSDETYNKTLKLKADKYISENTWDISANRYLEVYNKIIST
jgi:glycosyltransferase involved in cell wall biosynthesis